MTKPPAKATIITGEAQSKINNQITSLSIWHLHLFPTKERVGDGNGDNANQITYSECKKQKRTHKMLL
ncbi:TPA: hypothetical protein ACGO6G_001473 [Streptococcus suis]